MSLIQEALKRQQEEAVGGAEAPAKSEGERAIRLSPNAASAPPPPATAPELDAEGEMDPEMDFVLPVEGGGLRLRSRAQAEDLAAADADAELAASAGATDAEAVRVKPATRKSRPDNPVFHLLGVLVLLLLLLAGGGWAVFYGLRLLQRESTTQARPELAETTPASPSVPTLAEPLPLEPPTDWPAPLLPVPGPADPDAVAAAPAVDDPAMPGRPTPDDVTEVDAPVTGAEATPTPPEPDRETPTTAIVSPAPTVAPAPSTPEPAVTASPESVIWPYLQVTGVVGSRHSGSAMINGQIVDVGARIDGVRVLGLAGQAVRLEFQGEQRLVRVGRATE